MRTPVIAVTVAAWVVIIWTLAGSLWLIIPTGAAFYLATTMVFQWLADRDSNNKDDGSLP